MGNTVSTYQVKVVHDDILKVVALSAPFTLSDFESSIRRVFDFSSDCQIHIQYRDEQDLITIGVDDNMETLFKLNTKFLVIKALNTSASQVVKLLFPLERIQTSLATANDPTIMLSYSWTHQPTVLRIKDSLEKRGLTNIWMDLYEMEGNINDKMTEAVMKATVVIPCLSREYENSHNCKKELNFADQKRKPLVPVHVDNGPFSWTSFICSQALYIDLTNIQEKDWETKMSQLYHQIQKRLSASEKFIPMPTKHTDSAPTFPKDDNRTNESIGDNHSNLLPPTTSMAKFDLQLALDPEDIDMEDDIQALLRKCLPTTRRWLLQEIHLWYETESQILWIEGAAGTGKSSISAMTRDYLLSSGVKIAFFFFKSSEIRRNTALRFLFTLASQLVKIFPTFSSNIQTLIKENQAILTTQNPTVLFLKLIQLPLSNIPENEMKPVVVILDAIDECGSVNSPQRKDVLDMIRRWGRLPLNIKLMMTSRPEADIKDTISELSSSVTSISLHLQHPQHQEDLRLFAEYRISRLQQRLLLSNENFQSVVTSLVKQAGGLFVWLFLACEQIQTSAYPADEIRRFSEGSGSTLHALFELYRITLIRIFENFSPEHRDLGNQILGLVVSLQEPVSDFTISALLKSSISSIRTVLRALRSVLVIYDDQVQLLHKSFSDFLVELSPTGEPTSDFFVDQHLFHQFLSNRCLQILNETLKENILLRRQNFAFSDETDSPRRPKLPAYVSYAAKNWIYHLVHGGTIEDAQILSLSEFFDKHILHWIEVLSIVGRLNILSPQSSSLIRWLQEQSVLRKSPSKKLFILLLNDIRRLVTEFYPAISSDCLQVYVSAMALCPSNSELVRKYRNHVGWTTLNVPELISHNRVNWKPCIASIKLSQSISCNSLSWLQEGSLAAGYDDKAVRIWDSASGSLVNELWCHEDRVLTVSSTRDGMRFASGSLDKSICIWNSSGSLITRLLGHTDRVTSVCFSKINNEILFTASNDCTIRKWNLLDGSEILIGSTDAWINSIAISNDDTWLACGDVKYDVHIWDLQRDDYQRHLTGHTAAVLDVKFQKSGNLLASCGCDFTIRIWRANSGELYKTLTGHTNDVRSVAFSSDGSLLASCSDDKTVKIWNIKNGKQLRIMGKITNDGLLASAGTNGQILLWDTQVEGVETVNERVTHCHLSSDSTLLATATSQGIVYIYELLNGNKYTAFSSQNVSWVQFSSDSKRLAIIHSAECNFCIFEILSGKVFHLDQKVANVVFVDSSNLWLGTFEGTIRSYRLGENLEFYCHKTIQVHTNSITVMVTAHKEAPMIASGSIDRYCHVMDSNTGEILLSKLHRKFVYSLAFSSDNSLLACGCKDGSVTVYNVQSGVGKEFKIHSQNVEILCFSPVGQLLASGSVDCTTQVGCFINDDLSLIAKRDHFKYVKQIRFSSDGGYLKSTSADGVSTIFAIAPSHVSSSKTQNQIALVGSDADGWLMGLVYSGIKMKLVRLFWLPPDMRGFAYISANCKNVVLETTMGSVFIIELPFGTI
ncbi:hypothetical protein HK096_008364 [Nowakowskiella sp. JEL0078]|nr:hypothetical protein HK096_008364 [Nowakowskiella sp. JEL0078]